MHPTVFLDTSGLIAISAPRDRRHAQALAVLTRLQEADTRFLTHEGVRLELLDTLRAPRVRPAAAAILASLNRAAARGELETVPLDGPLMHRAAALFAESRDRRWGFVACISFVLMRERGVTEALTTDHHFEQAGFNRLLAP